MTTVLAIDQSQLERMKAAMASRPLLLPLLLVVAATALRLTGSVDADVSWQLWIAHQLNAGAHLNRGIIEVNPPLWFWMAVPIDRAATLFQVRGDTLLIIALGILEALSLIATARLFRYVDPPRRAWVLTYGASLLTIMVWKQAGQREHLVLLAAIPYALLIAARRDDRTVSRSLAGAIGAAAGIGFALKPHFLLAPIALELALFATKGRLWRPLRPETLAMAAVGAVYGLALGLAAPDYFRTTLPLVMLAYGETGAPNIIDLIRPEIVAAIAAVALILWERPRLAEKRSTAGVLALAAATFLFAYVIQAKGWTYHALPTVGCACAALAVARAAPGRPSRTMLLVSPAILLCPLLLAAQRAILDPGPSADLRQAVAGLRPGTSVGFVVADPALAWSIAYQRGLNPASRYMGFWMLRAVVANEQTGGHDPRLTALGRDIVAQTVADFRCKPPKRIIVARPRPGEDSFDILPFFLRNPEFAELLGHYGVRGRTTLETYDLSAPFPPAPASACQAGA